MRSGVDHPTNKHKQCRHKQVGAKPQECRLETIGQRKTAQQSVCPSDTQTHKNQATSFSKIHRDKHLVCPHTHTQTQQVTDHIILGIIKKKLNIILLFLPCPAWDQKCTNKKL